MVQALLEAHVLWQGCGGNKSLQKQTLTGFFLLGSMFGWFVQGLEKVMPQPVSREKQDTQVCSLQRGDGGMEVMCKAGGSWRCRGCGDGQMCRDLLAVPTP